MVLPFPPPRQWVAIPGSEPLLQVDVYVLHWAMVVRWIGTSGPIFQKAPLGLSGRQNREPGTGESRAQGRASPASRRSGLRSTT